MCMNRPRHWRIDGEDEKWGNKLGREIRHWSICTGVWVVILVTAPALLVRALIFLIPATWRHVSFDVAAHRRGVFHADVAHLLSAVIKPALRLSSNTETIAETLFAQWELRRITWWNERQSLNHFNSEMFCIKHGDQRSFSIWNHHKCLS